MTISTSTTSAPLAARHASRPPQPRSRLRNALRAVAIAACVPYLGLKIAWLTGSHTGIPEGSELLTADGETTTTLFALNLLTVVMDATVIVLAFALTRPWGMRLPGWLMLAPLWIATGLLAPIVIGFPATAVAELFSPGDGGDAGGGSGSGDDVFLDPWVFTVVYTGFIIQALALGGLLALYIRDRWGHVLRGRLAQLRPPVQGGAARATAVTATLLLLLPLTTHLLWLGGSTAGLNAEQIAHRDATFYVTTASDLLFALAAAAGALLLAFRPARCEGMRLATVVSFTWIGSAALAAWGGWLLLANGASLGSAQSEERATPLTLLTYSGQMITGLLILAVGARLLADRAGRASVRAA
jgi:hypothetical protein